MQCERRSLVKYFYIIYLKQIYTKKNDVKSLKSIITFYQEI